jgi:hypothetical protein
MSRIKRNELEGALDETSWTKAHGLEAIGLAIHLAMFDSYHLPRENASFRFVILRGQLWGERFQVSAFQRRRIVGRADRGSLGGKEAISSG